MSHGSQRKRAVLVDATGAPLGTRLVPGGAQALQATDPGSVKLLTELLDELRTFLGRRARSAGLTAAENPLMPGLCQGRLTVSSLNPLADGSGSGTLYWTPYLGNGIALLDGSSWVATTFPEISIASPSAPDTKYDVFCYNPAAPTLELKSWASNTIRNSLISLQDGVLVLTSDPTRRYLGTVRITALGFADYRVKRFVWNQYNRRRRCMYQTDATDSWTYSTAAYRPANGNTGNIVEFVLGQSEDEIQARVVGLATNSNAFVNSGVGIGVDSTTVNSAILMGGNFVAATETHAVLAEWASTPGTPAPGYHYLQWLEYGAGAGTTTWMGDNALAQFQAGLIASIFC